MEYDDQDTATFPNINKESVDGTKVVKYEHGGDIHNSFESVVTSQDEREKDNITISEVARTAVHGGIVTETVENSKIYISGQPQNETTVAAERDKSQSTVGNVIVNGGEANINFNNSQIHVGSTRQDISPPVKDEKKRLRKILSRLNEHAWKKSKDEITRDFKAEKLNEPSFKVYPQMEESPAFYKGGHFEYDDIGEDLQHSLDLGEDTFKTKEPSHRPIKIYDSWNVKNPNPISHESLKETVLAEIDLEADKPLGIIGLVAPAGSGKTTYLRRLARDTMVACGIIPANEYVSTEEKNRFLLILYIDLKSIRWKDSTTLGKILFEGFFQHDDDFTLACEWLEENESKTALFIDGLDQAAWSVEDSEQIELRAYDEAGTSLIIYNLLSRELLSNSRIVMTSREFKAATLPTRARPEKIITLTGFTDVDAEKLFKALVSCPYSEHPWDKLTSQSSSLARFLFTPLFLMFTAAVSCFTKIPLPKNMSGLVAEMLKLLSDSDNIHEAERIWEIIAKLKCLAHEGMERAIVIFTVSDLTKNGLSVADVRDLLLTVQKNRALSQRVSDIDMNIFFCHQSFQEFLSAMFITEMTVPDFKEFVYKHLHHSRWSVVRQFVFGIVYTLHGVRFRISDRVQKQQILSESLPYQMKMTKEYERLELYASLYESDDSTLIRAHLRQVVLKGTTLGHSGTHLVSCMMARCHALEDVTLVACGLTDQLLRVMASNLKPKRINVKCLDITWSMSELSLQSLNLLMNYLIVDELRINSSDVAGEGGLDWMVIQQRGIVDGNMLLNNEATTVTMKQLRARNLTGLYDKNDKTLHFNISNAHPITNVAIDALLSVEKFFDSTSVEVTLEGEREKQYLKYTNLVKMRNWNIIAKVGKVVLDCDVDHELESALIVSYVVQAKVSMLAIKVRNNNFNAIPDHEGLHNELSALGCRLTIELRNKVITPGWKALGRTHCLGNRIRDGEKASIEDMVPLKTQK